MKKYLFLILFLITVVNISAQVRITGKVFDGKTREPLSFANVTLYNPESMTPVTGGLSSDDGSFILNAKEGKYLIKVTLIGYAASEKEVVAEGESVRAGRFVLQEDTQQISEIEVIGQQSGMTLDIDKKVFNVSQDITSEGSTASEILNNIPSVNVDIDGNISLRNSSSVEIWINGRATGLSSSDQGQLLEMLPAETIEKVELITNPSAKYNPEGSAGIINIITKKTQQGGYFGNVTAGVSYNEGSPWPSGNLGFNFTWSNDKWDVNLNANARYRRRDRSSYSHRTSWADGDTTYLNQDSKNANERANGFLKAGFTYHIDNKNDISLNTMGMVGPGWGDRNVDYTNLNAAHDTTLLNRRGTASERLFGFYNVSADYKHMFEKDKHEISANATYSGHVSNSTSDYTTVNMDYPSRNIIGNTFQSQQQKNNSHQISAQVDYTNKLTKDSRIEAGVKANYQQNMSDDRTYDSISVENPMVEDPTKYNPFDYREQIYAAYLNYANRFDWFSFQLGIRCEETLTNTVSMEDGVEATYSRSYFQPFPSAYFSFTLPKNNELQLNYTRRINRPRGRMLNSYIDRSDPTNISQGNPLLMPEFGNNLELNYLKSWEYHTITVGIFYRYTENVIQNVSKLIDNDVMYSTYQNITYRQNAGIEFVAKNKLFKNYLDLTTSLSAYYDELGENQEYDIAKTQSFSWQARINANVKIISNLSAQVTGYYNSPRLMAQGKQDQTYSIDLGLKASFLDKRLTLSAAVRDILNSRFGNMKITSSDNFYQESMNTSSGRQYRLTLTYNFGNYQKNGRKNRNKGNDSNDSIDDMGDVSDNY